MIKDVLNHQGKLFITGLNGCSCHPFRNWIESKLYHNQKLKVTDRVRVRCTGKEGNIKEVCKGPGNYYIVAIDPQKYPGNNTLHHAADLQILVKEISNQDLLKDKKGFERLKELLK